MKPTKRPMQDRTGNIPASADALILNNPETGWHLYRLTGSKGDWLSLKLVHPGPIAGAANYWLGWHLVERRLAALRDAARLAAHRPKLYAWTEDLMANVYPNLSEEDMALDSVVAEDNS